MVLNIYQYVLDLPRWHFMAMLFSGYLFYYFIEVVKRPILAVKNGPFKEFLLINVPILEMKFWPTFWCVESRAQTVFASILRATVLAKINYRRYKRDVLVTFKQILLTKLIFIFLASSI